jgi:hypothetical protein
VATPTAYVTRDQLFALAMRADMLIPPARVVEGVDTTADTLRVRANGYPVDAPLELVLNGFATVPGGLAAGTIFYAKPVPNSDDLVQLAAAPGGPAIDITSAGAGVMSLAMQLGQVIDEAALVVSGLIDEALVNYGSPLVTWPPSVTLVAARLLAELLAVTRGLLRPDFAQSADHIVRMADLARKQLSRWQDGGEPLRGFPTVVDQTPDVLENATQIVDDNNTPNWLPDDPNVGASIP